MMFRVGLIAVVGMVFSGAACSSSSSNTATNPGEDAGVDAAPSASDGFRVLLLEPNDDALSWAPMKNATIAYIAPGATEPVETPVDETGVATLPAIDWAKGPLTLTSYGKDRIIWSMTGITADLVKAWPGKNPGIKLDGFPKADFFWFSLKKDSTNFDATLSGSITGKTAGDHIVLASIAGAPSRGPFEGNGDAYTIVVKSGLPLRLHAVEWGFPAVATVSSRGFEGEVFRWVMQQQPAVTGKGKAELNLATATVQTPIKVSGKIVLPGGDSGSLGGTSTCRFFMNPFATPGTHLGRFTKMDVSADKNGFEYQSEYITPADEKNLISRYTVSRTDGGYSTVVRLGVPQNGEVVDGFLEPPAVTLSSQALYQTWTADGLGADADLRAVVFDKQEGIWFTSAPPGAKSVTPPPLPQAVASTLPSGLKGALLSLAAPHPELPIYMKAAQSRIFDVTK